MEEMFGNFRVLLIYLSRLIVTLLTDTIIGHSFTRADEPCRRGGGQRRTGSESKTKAVLFTSSVPLMISMIIFSRFTYFAANIKFYLSLAYN